MELYQKLSRKFRRLAANIIFLIILSSVLAWIITWGDKHGWLSATVHKYVEQLCHLISSISIGSIRLFQQRSLIKHCSATLK